MEDSDDTTADQSSDFDTALLDRLAKEVLSRRDELLEVVREGAEMEIAPNLRKDHE